MKAKQKNICVTFGQMTTMKTVGRRKTFFIKNNELFRMPTFELNKAKISTTKVIPESNSKLFKDFIRSSVEQSYTSIFIKFLLYFYRVFGITFNGLTISSKTNASQTSKRWKWFGIVNNLLLIAMISITIYFWTTNDSIFNIKNKDKSLSIWLLIINRLSQLLVIIINSLYLQISGASILKFLLKFPINKRRFLFFLSILLIEITISLIALILDYVFITGLKVIDLILILIERIYFEIFCWTPTVISCFVSINSYWYLNSLQKILRSGHLRSASTLSLTRKSFVQLRDQIIQIDYELSIVHLANTAIAIYGCLVIVYCLLMGGKCSDIADIDFNSNQ